MNKSYRERYYQMDEKITRIAKRLGITLNRDEMFTLIPHGLGIAATGVTEATLNRKLNSMVKSVVEGK